MHLLTLISIQINISYSINYTFLRPSKVIESHCIPQWVSPYTFMRWLSTGLSIASERNNSKPSHCGNTYSIRSETIFDLKKQLKCICCGFRPIFNISDINPSIRLNISLRAEPVGPTEADTSPSFIFMKSRKNVLVNLPKVTFFCHKIKNNS